MVLIFSSLLVDDFYAVFSIVVADERKIPSAFNGWSEANIFPKASMVVVDDFPNQKSSIFSTVAFYAIEKCFRGVV